MDRRIELVVRGLDWDADAVDEILAQHFPDYSWQQSGGVTTVVAYPSATQTPLEAVLELNEAVQQHLPGVSLVEVYDDPVGLSDIAARVDVSREAARKWSHRPDFPPHIGSIGQGERPTLVWRWRHVSLWVAANGHAQDFQEVTDVEVAEVNLALCGGKAAAQRVPRGQWGDLHSLVEAHFRGFLGPGASRTTPGYIRHFQVTTDLLAPAHSTTLTAVFPGKARQSFRTTLSELLAQGDDEAAGATPAR